MTNKETFKSVSWPDIHYLQYLEKKAHKWAEDACNYDISEKTQARRDKIILKGIEKVFGKIPEGFFINDDPRGYALKIDPEKGDIEGLATDMGGYGLLASKDSFN